MGMTHVTSGRATLSYQHLYKAHRPPLPKSFLPKSLLKQMLMRENELRLSPEYQQRYEQVEREANSETTWLDITDQLQQQVVREFHLEEEMDEALLCLRCATQIYPDLQEIPLYVRYNRARQGDLEVGDQAPNVPVVQMNGEESDLHAQLSAAVMPRLNELYQIYRNRIHFCFVYILEAHAEDEWPIASARWSPHQQPIRYNQTRTLDQRLQVAKDFVRDFHLEMAIVLDRPDENLFERYYAPWPVRIYLFDGNHRLIYLAEPSETMLELNEIQAHLQAMCS